jgi:PAS domain S-box-containing protein
MHMSAPSVLIVDDQPRNLDVLEAMLGPTGCAIVRAESADEALLTLLRHEFAAIVLDIRMPGMNGIELAQLIKQRKRTQHVPIIFLTAHMVDEREILKGYGVGGVDYLSKPINPQILCSKVSVFVDAFRKTLELAELNETLQREIGRREEAQRLLQEANEQLERRVDERTSALVLAHEGVRSNEERLRMALETSHMGLWTLHAQSRRCDADDRVLQLFAIDRTDWDGRIERLFERIEPEDRARLEQAMLQAARGSGSFTEEYRVAWPDGTVVWLCSTGRGAGAGEEGAVTGLTYDVTERRTAELSMHEADRRKDEFIAMLAHELRNPLAPIRTTVSLLRGRSGLDADATARCADILERQTTHMARLLDDLLDVSRLSRGQLTLQRAPVSLTQIVQEAVETAQTLLERQRHHLTFSGLEADIFVQGDATRLTQVFGNILVNAAKYTEADGHIDLTVSRVGTKAEVRVRDSGKGIPPEMLERIFELFTTVTETRDASGGLGIGLALAKRLVDMHGGSIRASSEGPGKGAEFIVELPALAAQPRVANLVSTLEPVQRARCRVLVVDDNPDAADALAMLLNLEGCEVRTAYAGETGVQEAERFNPDVLLLDLGMAGVDGYEACRRIRNQPWASTARIVAVSGWGQKEDRIRTAKSGFDSHLVKPVDPAVLLELIRSVPLATRARPA